MKKLILIFSMLIIALLTINAQILPNWTWARAIGGTQGVQVQNVLMDNAGNMYVSASSFAGPLKLDGSIFSSETHQSVFVAKFDSKGILLWKATVMKKDSLIFDQLMPMSIMLDKWNNLYFTVGVNGCSGGNDTLYSILNASNGQKEFGLIGVGCGDQPRKAIIKLDPDGNLNYVSTIEGYGQAGKGAGGGFAINSSLVDGQGNLYLAGSMMADSIKFGSFKISGHAFYENSYIAKIDTGGNLVWFTVDSTSSPTYNGSEANSLVLDASGNPLVFGDFGSVDRKFGSYTIVNSGSSNLYFVSLDKNDGTPKSLLSYNGTGIDIAGTITSDANGNYYATGFTTSPSLFGFATSGTGNYATFLANIDSTAKIHWVKMINTELVGTPGNLKLVMGPDNYPILAGLFQAKSLPLDAFSVANHDTLASSTDYFVARIDPSKQLATYLNSIGSLAYDNDYNLYSDVHNMVTFIASLTDTVYYVSKDTLKYAPPGSGFLIAHFDTAGKFLGQASFQPYTNQSFSVPTNCVVQSYSGYIGVAGGFSSRILYLGNNTLNAQDTTYSNIFISKMGYTLSGTVYDQLNAAVTSAYAKLYILASTGPAVLLDSTTVSVDNGGYSFNDAPLQGSLVYAAPTDTVKYQYYVGTYAGNSMLWTGAAILDLVSTPPATFNITLKQILPITGTGIIAGRVSETLYDTTAKGLKSTGRPMKGASVVLVGKSNKGSDTIVAITQSNDQGNYQFNKVPLGNYDIWIDVTGLGMLEYYHISISDVAPIVGDLNYVVAPTGIYKDLSAIVKISKRVNDQLLIYPNPATDYVQALVPMAGMNSAQIDVFNISGARIYSVMLESSTNGNAIINTSNLPSGIYILKATVTGKTALYARFIKQ